MSESDKVWKTPDEFQGCECGDRLLVIVRERHRKGGPLRESIVTLVATEDGFDAIEDVYSGYSLEDGELWCMESDLCRQAAEAT